MQDRSASKAVTRHGYLLAVLVFVVGCGGEATTPPPPGPGFRRDVQPIFNVSCLGCHLHGRAIGSLDLAPEVSYQSLVSMPSTQSQLLLVAPGAPESSYLMHKLEGSHAEVGGGQGDRMPLDGRPLTDDQLARVRRWISDGAAP